MRRTAAAEMTMSRILIVAGEESGDKHAAKLAAEILARDPSCEIRAAGGERLAGAGATLLYNLVELAVLGSVEVLRNYARLRAIFHGLLSVVEEWRPDAVVLVDYPGFNIRLAKRIKARRLPARIVYYISPQVWAWGTRRKRIIARIVDRMLVILPFEKGFYADTAMPVEFVGHPALDDLIFSRGDAEFRAAAGFARDARLIALLPGSRWNEVRRHLPVMLAAAAMMKRGFPALEFVTPPPKERFRRFTEEALAASPVPVRVAPGTVYETARAAELVLVASGTATLETACLLKPMLIVYRVAWPTYCIGRLLVKLPYIGLVNVIAGERIMPEFIQRDASPERIAAAGLALLRDRGAYGAAVERLRAVRARVGEPGASARAAAAVLAELNRRPAAATGGVR